MKTSLFAFALLFISTLSFGQYSISGRVYDEAKSPVSRATVMAIPSYTTITTNSEGVFALSGLKSGQYELIIDHLGYKTIIDTIDLQQDAVKDYNLVINPFMTSEFVVEATRADHLTPVTYENISKKEIAELNLGQDMPQLLNQTVSMVTTSDAGAGVGYTGMRIRGSDATRINVTVNGVPINDSESHGVFWVNMPDLSSSTNNIQIQRGVGTSTNGAASFGASVNIETNGLDTSSRVIINNSYGSFNTRKHLAIINSGLIGDHFNFEGRLSYIGSDGFIDRSAVDLRSYYVSGGYYGEKMFVKALTFSGKEKTQQAWYGTPESRINGSDEEMLAHAANNGYSDEQIDNLLTSGRTYNHYLYDNEIDNYGQSHYHLVSGYQLSSNLYLNLTGHYTKGGGYFEQFKEKRDLAEYGIEYPIIGADTITESNTIVRRWLDNHFYGGVYSLQYTTQKLKLVVGGAINQYLGDHFGEVIWTEYASTSDIREQYYFSDSKKNDFSYYAKASYLIGKFSLFADMQYRHIKYESQGVDNDLRTISIDKVYDFYNPKAGVSYQANSKNSFYLSGGMASREPVRGDFTDAVAGSSPKPEFLTNAELGWNYSSTLVQLAANGYYMRYKDQLVLTGEVNDVGSPVRTNVPESYRAGLELTAHIGKVYGLYWSPNLTLSQNKIVSFSQTVYDYTNGFDIVTRDFKNTDIAFSPSIIGASKLGYRTKFGLHAAVLTKYVGRQYLDNTMDNAKSIDAYLVNDVLISYAFDSRLLRNIEVSLLVNNVLNELYESNGYTYSYIWGSEITENFYYPQAGTNYLVGLKWTF